MSNQILRSCFNLFYIIYNIFLAVLTMACLYRMAKNSQIQHCMLSSMPALLISLLIQVLISTAKIRKVASLIGFKSLHRFNIYRKRNIKLYADRFVHVSHACGLGVVTGKGTNISLIILFCRMHQTLPTALYQTKRCILNINALLPSNGTGGLLPTLLKRLNPFQDIQ